MRTIDSNYLYHQREQRRFRQAENCPHLMFDQNAAVDSLWPGCFCEYQGFIDALPQHCELVWRGKCIKDK